LWGRITSSTVSLGWARMWSSGLSIQEVRWCRFRSRGDCRSILLGPVHLRLPRDLRVPPLLHRYRLTDSGCRRRSRKRAARAGLWHSDTGGGETDGASPRFRQTARDAVRTSWNFERACRVSPEFVPLESLERGQAEGESFSFSRRRAHRNLQDVSFVCHQISQERRSFGSRAPSLAAGDHEDSPQSGLPVDLRLQRYRSRCFFARSLFVVGLVSHSTRAYSSLASVLTSPSRSGRYASQDTNRLWRPWRLLDDFISFS